MAKILHLILCSLGAIFLEDPKRVEPYLYLVMIFLRAIKLRLKVSSLSVMAPRTSWSTMALASRSSVEEVIGNYWMSAISAALFKRVLSSSKFLSRVPIQIIEHYYKKPLHQLSRTMKKRKKVNTYDHSLLRRIASTEVGIQEFLLCCNELIFKVVHNEALLSSVKFNVLQFISSVDVFLLLKIA